MPRQHTDYSRRIYVLPGDFRSVSGCSGEESGLSWAEMARRIETYPLTIRRWRIYGVRPSTRHQMALLALADSMGLGISSPTGTSGAGLLTPEASQAKCAVAPQDHRTSMKRPWPRDETRKM